MSVNALGKILTIFCGLVKIVGTVLPMADRDNLPYPTLELSIDKLLYTSNLRTQHSLLILV